jgi:hypothetical protein
MVLWKEAASSAFHSFATKEVEGEDVGVLFLDAVQLNSALCVLGNPLNSTDAKVQEMCTKSKKVSIDQFQAIAEKSLRWHLISCMNKETFINEFITPFLPEKLDDILKLDRLAISAIFSNQDFISSAANKMFLSLQQRKTFLLAESTSAKTGSVDQVWAESLVLGRGRKAKANTDKDHSEAPSRSANCFVPEKYKSHGRFLREDSSLQSFDLEEEIGPPDLFILRGILREHMFSDDSTIPFVSSTHGVLTTPLLELARLLGDEDSKRDKSAWTVLRDLANRGPDHGAGPAPAELDRIHQEIHALKEAFSAAVAARGGCLPGEATDSYTEVLVDVAVACDDAEAAADAAQRLGDTLADIEADWLQALPAREAGARGLGVASPPAARGADAAAVLALPQAEGAPTLMSSSRSSAAACGPCWA